MLVSSRETLDFRVGLHGDLNDAVFHTTVVQLIEELTIEQSIATFEADSVAIQKELLENAKENELQLRTLARMAFAQRYEAVPTTPTLSTRLSNGSHLLTHQKLPSLLQLKLLPHLLRFPRHLLLLHVLQLP